MTSWKPIGKLRKKIIDSADSLWGYPKIGLPQVVIHFWLRFSMKSMNQKSLLEYPQRNGRIPKSDISLVDSPTWWLPPPKDVLEIPPTWWLSPRDFPENSPTFPLPIGKMGVLEVNHLRRVGGWGFGLAAPQKLVHILTGLRQAQPWAKSRVK